MREFLLSRVVNGGRIPKGTQLQDHLLDVYELETEELKQKIKEANVAIMVDELSDDNGRCVIDVMATILDFDKLSTSNRHIAYLLDMHFVTETNNKTVSQAVVKTINYYGIDFDRVLIFNTDNASYMKKAFRETLSCLFSSCVHITCHSHIISLVAGDFKRHFSFVTEFAKCMPSGRKGHFLKYMNDCAGDLHSKATIHVPPNPLTKSWSAWFDSAVYHTKHFNVYEDFITQEIQRCGRNAASALLLRLEEMYGDDTFMKMLHAQLRVVAYTSPTLMHLMDYF